ncbi:class I SAM-dependent methyltransferase [Streptomyces chrestomyceticus]|uniref:class I SAM-dependent methyltransferase n=1 Tax=Streptomyces chrestomyceticus TaxID=68185 RepID=UPI003690397B
MSSSVPETTAPSAAGTGSTPSDVADGAAMYTRKALRKYDAILHVNTRWVWRCHHDEILRRYQAAVGAKHLEIGVGSGECPDRARFPVAEPDLTLLDLNPYTLEFASERLARYAPRAVRADALEPLERAGVPAGVFDSVAVNLVLHCVPGDLHAKRAVLENAAAAARSGGTVVGSTVLAAGVPRTPYARRRMRKLNERGIFHNSADSLSDLAKVLGSTFADFDLDVRGCMALFTATTA